VLGILIIVIVWAVAPWAGLFVTGYVLYNYFKKIELKNKIELQSYEEKEPETSPRLERTADEVIFYKNCTIEIFKELFGEKVRIIMPNGKDLGRDFKSVSEAMADIEKHIR